MNTWKLEIEYDGTRYRGWQMQQNAISVQGHLIKAAEEVFKSRVEIGGAGRTDAGVHARGQVAHLKVKTTDLEMTPRNLQYALNDRLPHDINILKVQNALPNFNARHDAQSRWYLYQISTRRTAFGKNSVWWIKDRLNLGHMQQAARILKGRHDFASFCESEGDDDSSIVVVERAEIFEDGDLICFRIGASHFLWKMVRRLVGVLAEIGRGKFAPTAMDTFLKKPSNGPAKLTAPPAGLFLEKVCYRGDVPPTEPKAILPI